VGDDEHRLVASSRCGDYQRDPEPGEQHDCRSAGDDRPWGSWPSIQSRRLRHMRPGITEAQIEPDDCERKQRGIDDAGCQSQSRPENHERCDEQQQRSERSG
jgi:hypothetical protein